MNQQSNALRHLEEILDEAVTKRDKNQKASAVLLETMKLGDEPVRLKEFYDLMSAAIAEAKQVKNKQKIDKYVKNLEGLYQFFIMNHLFSQPWNTFVEHIETRNILIVLDSLADTFHDQNPSIFLEKDFLDQLYNELSSLRDDVDSSVLSLDFKEYLIKGIEDIQRAIRKYNIEGTLGIGKAVEAFVGSLVVKESELGKAEKTHPVYKQVKTWIITLAVSFLNPSAYDLIGVFPDLESQFWKHRFEEVKNIFDETISISEAIEKISDVSNKQPQNLITGSDFLALPAAKEEPKIENQDDDED